MIVKIRLSDFAEAATLTLSLSEDSLHSSVIDAANGFAYFGAYTIPGRVVKIDVAPSNVHIGAVGGIIQPASKSAILGVYVAAFGVIVATLVVVALVIVPTANRKRKN
jgi:hypothetical protein